MNPNVWFKEKTEDVKLLLPFMNSVGWGGWKKPMAGVRPEPALCHTRDQESNASIQNLAFFFLTRPNLQRNNE